MPRKINYINVPKHVGGYTEEQLEQFEKFGDYLSSHDLYILRNRSFYPDSFIKTGATQDIIDESKRKTFNLYNRTIKAEIEIIDKITEDHHQHQRRCDNNDIELFQRYKNFLVIIAKENEEAEATEATEAKEVHVSGGKKRKSKKVRKSKKARKSKKVRKSKKARKSKK